MLDGTIVGSRIEWLDGMLDKISVSSYYHTASEHQQQEATEKGEVAKILAMVWYVLSLR